MIYAVLYQLYQFDVPNAVLGRSLDAAVRGLRAELLDYFTPGSELHTAISAAADLPAIECALRSELEYLRAYSVAGVHTPTAQVAVYQTTDSDSDPELLVNETTAPCRAELCPKQLLYFDNQTCIVHETP